MLNKKEKELRLLKLQENIEKYGNEYKLPSYKHFENVNTNSWFDMEISRENYMFESPNDIAYDALKNDGYKTRQLKLYLTKSQKNIIDNWFNMFIYMYNSTIKVIKDYIKNKKPIPSLTQLKKDLYQEKCRIRELSKFVNENGIVIVDSHLLDYAINDAKNKYESCLTNLKNKNIKTFRLRYLKTSKSNKIIKIEKLAFRENGFYCSMLGQFVECSVSNFNYIQNISTVATLTKRGKEYILLIKHKRKSIKNNNTDTISIDPGIRTYLTCYANDTIVKIGTNVTDVIEKKLRKIDKINNCIRFKNVFIKKRQKIVNKKYNKIKNMVDDMQWKASNYLVNNHKNILLGNLSTKRMGEQKMHRMTKRIGNMLSLFELKKKLVYKCHYKNVNYKEVEECYTSKCCGKCGNVKHDLGSAKEYRCTKCNFTEERDINSARLILLVEKK